MSENENILRARAYYYEFLSFAFFFYENDDKLKLFKQQAEYLSQNPLSLAAQEAFLKLKNISFKEFLDEQNSVLFDMSYINVPLNISFYEEGRDDGMARLRVIEILKKSQYRRNIKKCKNSEDYVGFVFMLMVSLLNDEINDTQNGLSNELFTSVINGFVDEFIKFLSLHEKSDIFKSISIILDSFIQFERSFLGIEAPQKDTLRPSIADEALNRKPYQTKMATPKSKIHWDEFSVL